MDVGHDDWLLQYVTREVGFSFNSDKRLAFAIGLSLRFGLHYKPQHREMYIVEYLFVVLSVSTLA